MVVDRILPLIRTVFVRYLGAQWTVALHILRFWSTHQYYRTVEYEANRTIGDGHTLTFVFHLWIVPLLGSVIARGEGLWITLRKSCFPSISVTNGPIRFILYGFEVLISTIEPQSMNRIEPSVTEIHWLLWFRSLNCITVGHCKYNGWRSVNHIAKTVFVIYLRHQRADSVHTL